MRLAPLPPYAAMALAGPIEQADAAHVNLLAWRITSAVLFMNDVELQALDIALAALRQHHNRMLEEAHPLKGLHDYADGIPL